MYIIFLESKNEKIIAKKKFTDSALIALYNIWWKIIEYKNTLYVYLFWWNSDLKKYQKAIATNFTDIFLSIKKYILFIFYRIEKCLIYVSFFQNRKNKKIMEKIFYR
jgi:hypothetical protein